MVETDATEPQDEMFDAPTDKNRKPEPTKGPHTTCDRITSGMERKHRKTRAQPPQQPCKQKPYTHKCYRWDVRFCRIIEP